MEKKNEENAKKKLRDKNLDMVVANSQWGLDSEYNEVTIINKENDVERLPSLRKREVAERILDSVVRLKSA